ATGAGSYTFVADNPIRLMDPDGRAECDTSNVDPSKLTPINDRLNTLVNARIDAARKAAGIVAGAPITDAQRKTFVDKVSDLGRPRGGGGLNSLTSFKYTTATPNKSEIEKFAAQAFPNQPPGNKYHLVEAWGQSLRAKPQWALGLGLGAWLVQGAVNPS